MAPVFVKEAISSLHCDEVAQLAGGPGRLKTDVAPTPSNIGEVPAEARAYKGREDLQRARLCAFQGRLITSSPSSRSHPFSALA